MFDKHIDVKGRASRIYICISIFVNMGICVYVCICVCICLHMCVCVSDGEGTFLLCLSCWRCLAGFGGMNPAPRQESAGICLV